MKKVHRVVQMLLAVAMVLSLAACERADKVVADENDTQIIETVRNDAIATEPEVVPEQKADMIPEEITEPEETAQQEVVEKPGEVSAPEVAEEVGTETVLETTEEPKTEATLEAEGTMTTEGKPESTTASGSTEATDEAHVEDAKVCCAGCNGGENLASYETRVGTVQFCETCYKNLQDAAKHYMPVMQAMSKYYTEYGLCDIDHDGIPEIISNEGIGIYTYRATGINYRWIFESMVVTKIYVDTATHRVLSAYGKDEFLYYDLFEMVDGALYLVESKSFADADFTNAYKALVDQMELVEYQYAIGDEMSLLEDMMVELVC